MSPPPRVLLLLHSLGLGGAEWAVVRLAQGLAGLGVPVAVSAWKRGGPLVDVLLSSGIRVEVASSEPKGLSRLLVPGRLSRWVRSTDTGIIHAHMSDAATLGVMTQARTRVPCIITHHSPDLVDSVGMPASAYRAFRKRLLIASARRAALNLAVSEQVRDTLALEMLRPRGGIVVVPNAVPVPDPAAVEDAQARRAARARATAKAIFVGRLVESKGVGLFLEALAATSRDLDLEATIVGEGPEAPSLHRMCARLGLQHRVRFVGAVLDVAPFLAEADFLVLPSRAEGEPLAVLEALSWALPVVASDTPGHRRLLAAGPSGWLASLDDIGALAASLRLAAFDAVERRARGVAGRLASGGHRPQAVAAAHLEIYRGVISARPGRRSPPAAS